MTESVDPGPQFGDRQLQRAEPTVDTRHADDDAGRAHDAGALDVATNERLLDVGRAPVHRVACGST